MKRTMIMVVVALMPALLFGFYRHGLPAFPLAGRTARILGLRSGSGSSRCCPSSSFRTSSAWASSSPSHRPAATRSMKGFLCDGPADPDDRAGGHPAVDGGAGHGLLGHLRQGGVRRYGYERFNPALLARAFAFFAYTPSMSGATVWIAGMTEDMKNVAANIPGDAPRGWWTASRAPRHSKT